MVLTLLRLSESKGNFGDSHVKGYSGSMESSRCMLSRDSDSGSPGVLMLLKYLSLPRSGFAGLAVLYLSNPVFHICRQVIHTCFGFFYVACNENVWHNKTW